MSEYCNGKEGKGIENKKMGKNGEEKEQNRIKQTSRGKSKCLEWKENEGLLLSKAHFDKYSSVEELMQRSQKWFLTIKHPLFLVFVTQGC